MVLRNRVDAIQLSWSAGQGNARDALVHGDDGVLSGSLSLDPVPPTPKTVHQCLNPQGDYDGRIRFCEYLDNNSLVKLFSKI